MPEYQGRAGRSDQSCLISHVQRLHRVRLQRKLEYRGNDADNSVGEVQIVRVDYGGPTTQTANCGVHEGSRTGGRHLVERFLWHLRIVWVWDRDAEISRTV